LNNLLASFERKRKEQAKNNTTVKGTGPKINVPPHSLPWPVQGKVLSQFGKEYRSDLNTWIFRDGIKIAGTSGAAVRASAAGSVIYAGTFRSYGNVVIMDHGKGFFTIYGFLKEVRVSVGDKVSVQETVGTVGKDTQASSGTGQYVVYFEIRQGTTAVDPLDWLK
jgi:septal ring factor EnvC (AmiA/AmiB activator)